jgi:hypothetical protein
MTIAELANRQLDLEVRGAIIALGEIHAVHTGGERYDRNTSGMILLDRLCYFSHRLDVLPATTRASAYYLIETECHIRVDVDLENLPCRNNA